MPRNDILHSVTFSRSGSVCVILLGKYSHSIHISPISLQRTYKHLHHCCRCGSRFHHRCVCFMCTGIGGENRNKNTHNFIDGILCMHDVCIKWKLLSTKEFYIGVSRFFPDMKIENHQSISIYLSWMGCAHECYVVVKQTPKSNEKNKKKIREKNKIHCLYTNTNMCVRARVFHTADNPRALDDSLQFLELNRAVSLSIHHVWKSMEYAAVASKQQQQLKY